MADTGLTGATTDVTVDTAALAKEKTKKTIIKVVVIAAALLAAYWIYKKFIK
jgi:hypothetical protein